MMARRQKNFKIRADIAAQFKKTSNLLGLTEQDAAELALSDWIKKNGDEAQKRLDLYAGKGITIVEPETVNIAVFQKAEVLVAKQELERLLGVLEEADDPAFKKEIQLELAKALRMVQPIFVRTRDPELLELLRQVERQLVSSGGQECQ